MADKAHSVDAFSLAQARHIVKDLFTPRPAIYWADFLVSTIGGMACFTIARRVLTPYSIQQAITLVVCGLCFYRAVLFTHELVHVRDKSFRLFRIVWNLLCGIPFLMPSFTYYTHVEHHTRKLFSTENDGEYLALSTTPRWHILLYLCQPFVIPPIAVVRFLILAPISWVSPTFRDFVHRHCSSMVMDPTYIRPLPTKKVLQIFRLQEVLCFLWVASITTLLVLGRLPIGFPITAYLISVMILMLNNIRTLGAHRYTNPGGEVTFVEQLLDSVNYPRWPFLSELLMPVGLRYHGLHHLFPSLPYHNLAKAHKRLMAELPADSPYRLTVSTGLFASLKQLWSRAHKAEQEAERFKVNAPRPRMTGGEGTLTGARQDEI